jgi:hypothetical protein
MKNNILLSSLLVLQQRIVRAKLTNKPKIYIQKLQQKLDQLKKIIN